MKYTFENLEEVKREAIAFRRFYPVAYMEVNEPSKVISWAPSAEFLGKWQECYSVNNGVIAFVCEDTLYVIPNIANVKELIKWSSTDFERFKKMSDSENNFNVPLSNGERLENAELNDHWEFLLALQRECRR